MIRRRFRSRYSKSTWLLRIFSIGPLNAKLSMSIVVTLFALTYTSIPRLSASMAFVSALLTTVNTPWRLPPVSFNPHPDSRLFEGFPAVLVQGSAFSASNPPNTDFVSTH